MKTYVLKPRPPLRAFAIAAAAAVLALLLIVVGGTNHWHLGVIVIGWVLLLLALALLGLALWSMQRMRLFVDLDEKGYAITGAGADTTGTWADVKKVTSADGGAVITFYGADGVLARLISPQGTDDADMRRLAGDLSAYLDASRGYRHVLDAQSDGAVEAPAQPAEDTADPAEVVPTDEEASASLDDGAPEGR